jgi:hypothetical protein
MDIPKDTLLTILKFAYDTSKDKDERNNLYSPSIRSLNIKHYIEQVQNGDIIIFIK